MFLIDLSEKIDTILAVEVKPNEFAEIDRLEAALDLGADPSRLGAIAASAASSLAGAADIAALAWARGEVEVVPAWAAPLSITWPVTDWLVSRFNPAKCSWVEEVPSTSSGHQPGSRFIVFQDAAATALTRGGMSRSSALKVLGAFAEMADNATDHSDSRVPPFATFEVGTGAWEFSVTDLGRGLPDSLRTNPVYASLGDREAVREALKDGVSRYTSSERGFGFGAVFRALAEMNCSVRLRTGGVAARWSGRGVGLTDVVYELVSPRAGVHVRVKATM